MLEPFAAQADMEDRLQFVRHGYFISDKKHSTEARRVFNRIVSLKDSWGKK